MLGGIIMLAGCVATGKALVVAIRKLKEKYPDVFKKYRFMFLLLMVLLFVLGFSFSVIAGGLANGTVITNAAVILVLKLAVALVTAGFLVVTLEQTVVFFASNRKYSDKNQKTTKKGHVLLLLDIVFVSLLLVEYLMFV